jgi:hypothetical protein
MALAALGALGLISAVAFMGYRVEERLFICPECARREIHVRREIAWPGARGVMARLGTAIRTHDAELAAFMDPNETCTHYWRDAGARIEGTLVLDDDGQHDIVAESTPLAELLERMQRGDRACIRGWIRTALRGQRPWNHADRRSYPLP